MDECIEVIEVTSDPTPKRRKLTDFFTRLPSNSDPQDFLGFLRRYQPTDVRRRPARSKHQRRADSIEECVSIVQSSPESWKLFATAVNIRRQLLVDTINVVATNSRLEKKGRHLLSLEQQ